MHFHRPPFTSRFSCRPRTRPTPRFRWFWFSLGWYLQPPLIPPFPPPHRDDGVGLAAPQVGVNVRLMVFNPMGRDKPGNESILVNPEIVEQLGGKELGEEGCLSFPRIYGDVEVRGAGCGVRGAGCGGGSCGGARPALLWVPRAGRLLAAVTLTSPLLSP